MNKPRIVGPTIMVPVGGEAVMTAPNPDADPHIEWSLRYSSNLNDPKAGRFSAAAVVESYAYLLSNQINMTEATRRLRVLRGAVRERRFWTRTEPPAQSAGYLGESGKVALEAADELLTKAELIELVRELVACKRQGMCGSSESAAAWDAREDAAWARAEAIADGVADTHSSPSSTEAAHA